MRRNKNKIKLVLAIVMQLALILPTVAVAQTNDNFFFIDEDEGYRGSDYNTDFNGTWGSMTITDYETGSVLPVGDGLWILAIAAGIYMSGRILRSRKAAMMIMAALATSLGMTQCRKPQFANPAVTGGEQISFSFMAGSGGAKTDVNLNSGKITWNEGDKVYVVCNSAKRANNNTNILLGGYLEAETGDTIASRIKGTVTIPDGYTIPENNAVFRFYYVGSKVTTDGTTPFSEAPGAEALHFYIINQDGTDAGEYMIGRTDEVLMNKDESGIYKPATNPQAYRLFRPLTAVLWLDSHTGFGDCSMTMHGANSSMTINLSNGTPYYESSHMTFTGGNNVQLSVLPTTGTPDATLNFSDDSKNCSVTVKNGISAGHVYAKIVDATAYPIPLSTTPAGVVSGEYSVSATQKVYFSPGNLQWSAKNGTSSATTHATAEGTAAGTWRFAENQYDYVGDNTKGTVYYGNTKCNNASISSTYSGWIDLFGWGTSAYHYSGDTGNKYYYPYSSSNSESGSTTNKTGYGPSIDQANPHISGSYYDWGMYNAIYNPSSATTDTYNTWRTLTADEWVYLINTRTVNGGTGEGHSYQRTTLTLSNGTTTVYGLLLLPDDFSGSVSSTTSWTDWQSLENLGVVFLPAGGDRNKKTVNNVKSMGNYWSGNRYDRTEDNGFSAWYLCFSSSLVNPKYDIDCARWHGYSVRLVQDITQNGAVNQEYEIGPVIPWGD